MAASCSQNDLDTGFMGRAQGRYIACWYLKIRVSQSAVNIQRQ
jgi:hypothetical protein